MGPAPVDDPAKVVKTNAPAHTIVFQRALGSNVTDVDGNRYVDLAAGFGSLLLGHAHSAVKTALEVQADRLWQAQGDVYPSDAKVGLLERLSELFPEPGAQVILGQSGADAVTAALKTAVLATGRPGVLAFGGAYHGLSYAPLSACGLRAGYRDPFLAQLNPNVQFLTYPEHDQRARVTLADARHRLAKGDIGAVLVEPILGRGGVIVPPAGFLRDLAEAARAAGALFVADEIWTGLGRSGQWLYSVSEGALPDLVCLGKGLGGGLPISACIGRGEVMRAWRRTPEVVHTSTFAGAPLSCACALVTLSQLSSGKLIGRARDVGERWKQQLTEIATAVNGQFQVRGAGMMLAIELGGAAGAAVRLQQALLERGYLVSTGGGQRDALVLTPPLNIDQALLEEFCSVLGDVLKQSVS
jgi:4-aminobutyrate aminotransferase/(S)-3-amino-2-methylpropionate transaminase